MSTASTVPMFAPDGTLGDIPYERMHDAVKAGGIPGVNVKAPDGTPGVVPANRVQDAVKAGGQIVPLGGEDQQQSKPGFWQTLGSDLKGAAGGIGSQLGALFQPGNPAAIAPSVQTLQADQQRKAEGRGFPYRAGAIAATGLGANVQGMEQAANEGNPAAVLGHTASAELPFLATLGAKGAAKAAATDAGQALMQKLNVIPSEAHATAGFSDVMRSAKSKPVPVTDELSQALSRYQELADAGNGRSLGVTKLMNRLTDPDKGPLSYKEARDFYSPISRLSANEYGTLSDVMKKQVGAIRVALNNAITQTAQDAGKGEVYSGSMKEFASAKRLNKAGGAVKDYAVGKALDMLPWMALGYGVKRAYEGGGK